jgi:hypothetical protein
MRRSNYEELQEERGGRSFRLDDRKRGKSGLNGNNWPNP